MKRSVLCVLVLAGLTSIPALRAAPEVTSVSIAGYGVIELPTPITDLSGTYAVQLPRGMLALDLAYDAAGRLRGSGRLGARAVSLRGSVALVQGRQRVTLQTRRARSGFTLTGGVEDGALVGVVKFAGRRGPGSAPVDVRLPLPDAATGGVLVSYLFAQDAEGRVTATADVWPTTRCALTVRGRGRLVDGGAGPSANIRLKGNHASVRVSGPVDDQGFDATWTLTLPGGLRNFSVRRRLPAQGAAAPSTNLPALHGVVLDATTSNPLAGATISVLGRVTRAVSGPDGRFAVPILCDGRVKLVIEKPGYTYAHRVVTAKRGVDGAVEPARLLPLDPAVTAIGPAGGTHVSSTGDVQLDIPAGAVATTIDVRATNTHAAGELPAPLPPTSAYTCCVNLQPELQTFSAPVTVRVKNECGFPPGTQIPVGVYRKDGDEWKHEAVATVSADGQWMIFATKGFSWHDVNLPAIPPPEAKAPKNKGVRNEGDPETKRRPGCDDSHLGVGSSVGVRDGELSVEHSLPAYRSLGAERAVRFVYASRSASPSVLLARDYDVDEVSSPSEPGTLVPRQNGFHVEIAGTIVDARLEASADPCRFAYLWDGRNAAGTLLPTGSYPYTIALANEYEATYWSASEFAGPGYADLGVPARQLEALETRMTGYVTLRNATESPYGAGWGVTGVYRVVRRADGALVFIDCGGGTSVHRMLSGLITTVAGNDSVGGMGYGGDAIDAALQLPMGVAVGPSGDLYVADTWANSVARIDPDGQIHVFAGTREQGFSGDGGRADLATLAHPRGVAVGLSGEVYVADTLNDRIRKIAPDGTITTVAGHGEEDAPGDAGDGGPATAALLNFPRAVAVSPSGEVFIADSRNDRIRKIGLDGIISTVAGNGTPGAAGDGGPAVQAQLDTPGGIAFSPAGDLYIADTGNERIRRVGLDGVISTFAGTGTGDSAGDGGAATVARLDRPTGIAVGAAGEVYVAETEGHRVRRIAPDGIISTFAGDGTPGYSGDGGPAAAAGLFSPQGLAVGPAGELYIADTYDNRVRRVHGEKSISQGPDFSVVTANSDGTVTRQFPDGSRIDFDSHGLETEATDANGNVTAFAYVLAGGRTVLAAIVDPLGRSSDFAYDADGRLAQVTDPCGRATTFTVDAAGDLVAISNPDGSTRSFTYDIAHRLVAQVDAGGMRTEYAFDVYGEVTGVVKAVGTADEQPRAFHASLSAGIANAFGPGEGTEANPAPRTDPGAVTEAFTNAVGALSSSRTNAFGSPTELTDPLGNMLNAERSPRDLVTTVTRPRGGVLRYDYDGRGNPVRIKDDATGAVTLVRWHPTLSVPTRVTDPVGAVTSSEYDAAGNLTKLTDPAGNITTFTYAARGLLASRTDALGAVTAYTYDTNGNIASVTDAAGHRTDVTCDTCGRVTAVIDANGRTTQYVYNSMNLRTEIHDALGGVTKFEYAAMKGTADATSREPLAVMTKLIDAAGHATTFAYDALGRLVTQTDPLGRATRFQYDAEDRLVKRTDAKAQETTYAYDAAGRLAAKHLPGNDVLAFEYDADGNVTRVADSDSDLRSSYDAAGRLTQVATQAVAGYPATTVGYEYDVAGRIVKMTDPAGGITNYAYDLSSLLTQIVDPASHATDFAYDALDRRSQMTAANGVVCAYTYDVVGNLLNMAYTKSAATVARFAYTYDAVGNRVSMTDGAGTHAYTLDALYRLTGATHPEAFNPTESYTYDAVGNRLSSHLSSAYTYDAADQLLSDDTYTYAYDANGNLASRTKKTDATDVTKYSYDGENRFAGVTFRDGGAAAYRYDGVGRRIERNLRGVVTRYVYDREDVLSELDGGNADLIRYTHGPEVDEPLVAAAGSATDYFAQDAIGSVRLRTDAAGSVIGTDTFDAFGRRVGGSGSPSTSYSFSGRQTEAVTGLFDLRWRTYDSTLGRFLSRDPIDSGFRGTNSYGYGSDNPTTYTDQFGLFPIGPFPTQLVPPAIATPPAAASRMGACMPSLGAVIRELAHLVWDFREPIINFIIGSLVLYYGAEGLDAPGLNESHAHRLEPL